MKNKDMLVEKFKQWYESDNAKIYYERAKVIRNVKVTCPTCHIEVSKSNLRRHMKLRHL